MPDHWRDLIAEAGAKDLWRQSGELHVYRSKEAWEGAQPSHLLRRISHSSSDTLSMAIRNRLRADCTSAGMSPCISPNCPPLLG